MITAQDVADVAQEMLGVTLELDHTGGNCAALVGQLEAGYVIVVTDIDVLIYGEGMTQPMVDAVTVSIYTHDAWHVEQDAPTATGYCAGTDTNAQQVRWAIAEALQNLHPAL